MNPIAFRWLDTLWGPHSLDCFASLKTRQLPRYCSRWWNPGCFAVDAFTVDWSQERVWLVPPVHIIARVIDMLLSYECHGTLVVPEWKSALWWPKLHSGSGWMAMVKGVVYLPKEEDTFVAGTFE